MSEMPQHKNKRTIKQIMPAPDWWAMYGESHEDIDVSLPLAGWALVDSNKEGEQVCALIAVENGCLEFADRDQTFQGLIKQTGATLPPNAKSAVTKSGDGFNVEDLKLTPAKD